MVLCSKCGFPPPAGQRIKSRHTGLTYCTDMNNCARRIRNELTEFETNWLAEKTLADILRAERENKRQRRMQAA